MQMNILRSILHKIIKYYVVLRTVTKSKHKTAIEKNLKN